MVETAAASAPPTPKNVVVLGVTGSIGRSACSCARQIPDRMKIVGMAARSSAKELAELANEFRPSVVCLVEEAAIPELRARLEYEPEILAGTAGLEAISVMTEAEMVLVAIVGTAGLRPALAAIEAGKDLAVASKEILVMAGEAVMSAAAKHGVNLLPVDSEHNAIFQCLRGLEHDQVRRILLTASGGPFRTATLEQIAAATPEQALRHPTWEMGKKITIDSATMFNKGLEMIEARWLFNVPMSKIEVVVHPQSIVHSMVETVDGSVLAQMSHSSMCFPIQYAITFPERFSNDLRPLNFAQLGRLDFEAPREDAFPALRLARQAGTVGGLAPAVLNAANEVAVEAFLNRVLSFPGIAEVVEKTLLSLDNQSHPDLPSIINADAWARREARAVIDKMR
jgi:1-deoxy-D-xylulose-5-phosphate reductoisomerase